MIKELDDLEIEYMNQLSNYKITKNPFSFIIGYIVDKKIVGFLDYSVMYERMEINYIYVLEQYRNNHIATKLLDYILKKHNECQNITLEVNIKNEIAIHLYQTMGFEIVGKRPLYYDGVDAYLMERRNL